MAERYMIPVKYSEHTRYQLGALAREIMLRRLEPTPQLGTDLHVRWWDKNLESIDLISKNIDGPYLLSKKSLGTSALNKYSFNQYDSRIDVEFDAATDLTQLDLTRIPYEIEQALLDSDSVKDVLPRDSSREVDREEAEEMFALLCAQHVAGSRLPYPRHSRELTHEIPTEQTHDFDITTVNDWIDLAAHISPEDLPLVYDNLYEIAKGTVFSTSNKEVFVWGLTSILSDYRKHQMAMRAIESGKTEHINPESTS